VAAAEEGAAVAVGYDPTPRWGEIERAGLVLTDSWADVTAQRPYQTVFLYDVLDHADDPVGLLRQTAEVLAPGGTILIRFHPWCGRHGGHLYRAANKAYLHLFLSDAAGRALDDDFPCQKVIQPLKTYRRWVEQAGLRMLKPEVPQIDAPEPFFLAQREAIARHWVGCDHEQYATGTFPTQPLSISFLDCVVGR
jgi:SAM-dependent methyltransferase